MTLPAIILLVTTLWVTHDLKAVPARHLRKHELGAELRAAELAHNIEASALAAGVPVRLYSAVIYDETAFDGARVSPAGAEGLPQLMPGTPRWLAWRRECRQPAHYNCEASSLFWGALALREALDACGSELAAVGRYRSGHCGTAGDAQGTLELARWIGEQLGDHQEHALTLNASGLGPGATRRELLARAPRSDAARALFYGPATPPAGPAELAAHPLSGELSTFSSRACPRSRCADALPGKRCRPGPAPQQALLWRPS